MSKVLVWVEHDNASVKDATLSAVTAAGQLGEVTALVVGSGSAGHGRQVGPRSPPSSVGSASIRAGLSVSLTPTL